MDACIFVDGENLRHSLCDLFKGSFAQDEYLPRQAYWADFFNWLASQAYNSTRLRTYWYVIENLDFYPHTFPKNDPEKLKRLLLKSKQYDFNNLDDTQLQQRMSSIVEQLINDMDRMTRRFRGWMNIQSGIERGHEAIEFRRAGSCTYNLFWHSMGTEKGVDVKLATDLLELRNIYDVAIIVSGDQDYVPAVKIIKDSGKRVVNVVFKTRTNQMLPGGAWRLNITCDHTMEINYPDLAAKMNLMQTSLPTK